MYNKFNKNTSKMQYLHTHDAHEVDEILATYTPDDEAETSNAFCDLEKFAMEHSDTLIGLGLISSFWK